MLSRPHMYAHTHTLIYNNTKTYTHTCMYHAIMLEDTYVQKRVNKANLLPLLFKRAETESTFVSKA